MKKSLFLSVIALLLFYTSNAQTSAVKINPIGLIFGVANAGYEFEVSDSRTVTISGIYYSIGGISGFGVGGEYRFYLSDDSLRGWHAGPSVGYLGLSDDFNNSSGFFTIGGEGGHQWIIGDSFVVDAFASVGFLAGNSSFASFNTVSIGIGASIGYAW